MALDDRQPQDAIPPDLAGQTLGAALRRLRPGLSWSQAKRLIVARRVEVNRTLCVNDARRLSAGDVVTILEDPAAPVPRERDVRLLHIDPNLVVLDKPAGLITLRRDEERSFSAERKALQPSLDELLPRLLPAPVRSKRGRSAHGAGAPPSHHLFPVHRLDRDTSGLMLFALSVRARDALIRLFSRHEIRRSYLAVAVGRIERSTTIDTHLVRDRGDGLRGSTGLGAEAAGAQRAITHIRPVEIIAGAYTRLECRLETGRTHQIRIHLAELGHPLCGEKLYTRPAPGASPLEDKSNAPRQALHSASLEFAHPMTRQTMQFASPLPKDLAQWLDQLGARQSIP